ncbi:PAS domain-containing protein [Solirubrobacter phytolaccae]|uniref:PAS domain-containing protein n=1 Tax=Solirubrobacter phytolaccae TaxID=1404360 RepID=A0A9X3N7D0_9ACTN|nr:PAS domain-containing protein [Solirubrobacter phytolaccae]MDA0181210.1 PAS domain-containing protein [Solirubrobacter phytolaccae]
MTAERRFTIDELFVSTTDRKGHIRLSNRVFERVSGYERDELIGRAHNVIRHPDMPRSVFDLFWQVLEAGDPVAAYVKNRAKDGAHYWVMAVAIPVPDGYLSVRMKPTTPLFDAAVEIYADVRAVELEVEGDDVRGRKASIAAGAARLAERLEQAGFDSYPAFMRAALTAEVAARDAALAGHERGLDLGAADAGLRAVGEAALGTVDLLRELGERLAGHGELSEALKHKSGFVEELSEAIRLFSLNAILAADRLRDGRALGAVAGLLRTRSDAAAPEIIRLGTELEQAVALLSETSFRAAAGKLQTEMMTAVVEDLLDASTARTEAASHLQLLADAVSEAFEAICASIAAVDTVLDRLAGVSKSVERHLSVIRALEVNGRIEAARAADTEQVRVLFEEIAKQVETADTQLHDFTALATREDRDDGGVRREGRRRIAAVQTAVGAMA